MNKYCVAIQKYNEFKESWEDMKVYKSNKSFIIDNKADYQHIINSSFGYFTFRIMRRENTPKGYIQKEYECFEH